MNAVTLTRSTGATRFVALTFFLSWLTWGALILLRPEGGLAGMPPEGFLLAFLGGMGPSLAALLLTWLDEGKAGVKALLGRLLRWRVSPWLYLVMLLPVPAVTLLARSLFGWPGPADLAMAVAGGAAWAVMSSLGEEFGWRGYLLPRLQTRYSPLVSSLLIGLTWGMWHFPAIYFGTLVTWGKYFFLIFVLLEPVQLTALAILQTWLYNRSGGGLLLCAGFHFTITFSSIALAPVLATPEQHLLSAVVTVAAICLLAVPFAWLGGMRDVLERSRVCKPSRRQSRPVAIRSDS